MIWYDDEKQTNADIQHYFEQLKSSILKKIKKADIHQKRMKIRKEDFFIQESLEHKNILLINTMHFLQHKFTEEDQLTMKFDLSNKLIEIRF